MELRHEIFELPCGHYTTGQFPFKLMDGLAMCRFAARSCKPNNACELSLRFRAGFDRNTGVHGTIKYHWKRRWSRTMDSSKRPREVADC